MIIGNYGSINIDSLELLSINIDNAYNVNEIEKVSGDSSITKFGNNAAKIDLKLRYNEMFTSPNTPDDYYEDWISLGNDDNAYNLTIGTKNYGNFIIKNIKTARTLFVPCVIEIDVNLISASLI